MGWLSKTNIWWKSKVVSYRFRYRYRKTNDIFKDIQKDVKTRFDTSNYELGRPLPKEKNKKVIGLM